MIVAVPKACSRSHSNWGELDVSHVIIMAWYDALVEESRPERLRRCRRPRSAYGVKK